MRAEASLAAEPPETVATESAAVLTEAALAAMGEAEAEATVCKDAVWPPPDWRAAVAAGTQPRAAALVKLIRDRIPGRPNAAVQQMGTHYSQRRLRSAGEVRRDYVKMLGIVRDALSACRTPEDVRRARTEILKAVGWSSRATAEVRHLVTSVWRDRIDTLQVDYRDSAKAEAMVQEGWPGRATPTWRRGHSVSPDGDGGYMVSRGVYILADGFRSEGEAWDWLRQQSEERRAAHRKAPRMPERPTVPEPARAGMPPRRRGDVQLLKLLDTFGLRSVEFGKWVPQDERQSLINQTWDALHDLCATTGLEPPAIGLGGTLGLSFGAKSGGGRPDYEAGSRTIALPRTQAAGELAHCWAHAFDHWSGDPSARRGGGQAATGWSVGGRRPEPEVGHLVPEEAEAWRRVTASIWCASPEAAGRAAAIRADLDRRAAEVEQVEQQRAGFLARNPAAGDTPEGAAYLEQSARWLSARRDTVIPELKARLAAAEADAARESSFAAEARRLCGKDGSFWARPGEMFARAFEAAVLDAMARRGGSNEFLVIGAEEGRFADGFRGNPYPAATERAAISEAVARLVAVMSPRLHRAAAPEAGHAEGQPEPDGREEAPRL